MPNYDFRCPHCDYKTEVYKRMEDIIVLESCPVCSETMYRVYQAPNISCTVSRYSNVLGIDLANKAQVNDYKARYEHQTGHKLVEVGNEDVRKHIKPKSVDWDSVTKKAIYGEN